MSRAYEIPSRSGKRRRSTRWPQRVPAVPKLACIKAVPANQLRFGAVVWAHVPFNECDGHKTRPAVVVTADRHHVVVLPGFTGARRLRYPDRHHEITDLEGAGLARPTGLRLEPVRLDRVDLLSICGVLAAEDSESLRDRIDLTLTTQLLQETHAA